MLISGVGYLIAIWNYNYFDNFMVTRLYKIQKPKDDEGKISKSIDYMVPPKLYNPKEYFKSLLPSFLKRVCQRCCKPNRLERGFEKARKKMSQETNIIEIIKSRRIITAALRIVLKKAQRL